MIVLMTFLVILSVGIAGCLQGTITASTPPTTYQQPSKVSTVSTYSQTTSYPTTTMPSVKTFKVGESASDGTQTVTLNSVKYIQYNSIKDWNDYFNEQLPGGQVVMLDITVQNLQNDKTQNADWGSIISDDNGYTYHTGGYSMMYSPYTQNNPEINKNNILPGDKRRGCEGFLVPINAKGLKYQYNFGHGYIAVFNLQ